jgi:chromosome partitioning protein
MAKVIAVANLKGGAGKSTTAINLAAAAQMAGIPTAIIDIDPEQQAASRWKDGRAQKLPEVKSAVHTRLPQSIAEMEGKGAALIIIDCPALAPNITTKAVEAANLVLVPCRTTVQDIQFLATTIEIAASHQKPAAVLLNAIEAHIRETEEARAFIEKSGFFLAPVCFSKAVAYHRAITAGQGVTEFEPNGKAAQEIQGLLDWISGLLDLSTSIHTDKSKKKRRASL